MSGSHYNFYFPCQIYGLQFTSLVIGYVTIRVKKVHEKFNKFKKNSYILNVLGFEVIVYISADPAVYKSTYRIRYNSS
jgi:hypothetical protein